MVREVTIKADHKHLQLWDIKQWTTGRPLLCMVIIGHPTTVSVRHPWDVTMFFGIVFVSHATNPEFQKPAQYLALFGRRPMLQASFLFYIFICVPGPESRNRALPAW